MASDQALTWMYCEDLCTEHEALGQARAAAHEYAITAISPATGGFLRFLVNACEAKNIVEIGTGTGVSGLYLLANSDVVLTSIDVEREAQAAARECFASTGIRVGRTRLINGRSADLLPRLAPHSYDMVVLDGDPLETPGDVQEALRLLKPGGTLVVLRALMGAKVADPARREEDVVTMRDLGREILSSEDFTASLIPVGDGVLVAKMN